MTLKELRSTGLNPSIALQNTIEEWNQRNEIVQLDNTCRSLPPTIVDILKNSSRLFRNTCVHGTMEVRHQSKCTWYVNHACHYHHDKLISFCSIVLDLVETYTQKIQSFRT